MRNELKIAMPSGNVFKQPGTHPGLLLQRYLQWSEKDGKTNKPDLAQYFSEQSEQSEQSNIGTSKNSDLGELYKAAYKKWCNTLDESTLKLSFVSNTESRMIIGLGNPSPLEVGLQLQHLYGTPIIPGSALKGLAAHYCHEVWGRAQFPKDTLGEDSLKFQNSGNYHNLIFGTTEDSGVITFHDAWITPETLDNAFCLDVMTPHHPQWQNQGAQPPSDFDSPIPISFISIKGTFKIHLTWRGPKEIDRDTAQGWLSLTKELLSQALEHWGIGGKTSSGYGRMVKPLEKPSESTAVVRKVTPKPNDIVKAELLPEKTKGGNWKALHKESELSGEIRYSSDAFLNNKAGDIVELIVSSADSLNIAFKLPNNKEAAKPKSGKPPRHKHH